ncbi:MAG: cytochrome c biogenesis protein CcsA [Deltaproteobacteria bacterium]|nr:cytochrome c biogenesis protein CcsA [Deltaproteobacteria bacterium]
MDDGLFNVSISLFAVSSFGYLAATVFYLVLLARESKTVGWLATGILWVTVAAHTAALTTRWFVSGWHQPPWTNLYESLVYFAWGVGLVYAIFEVRAKNRLAGAFVIPIAFILMGLAALSQDKEVAQVMPALQSRWLHIHVSFACFAYAAFFTGFGFAFLYLVRDGVTAVRMLPWAAAGLFVTIVALEYGDLVKYGEFTFDSYRISAEGGVEMYPLVAPYVGPLSVAAGLFSLSVIVAGLADRYRENPEFMSGGRASGAGRSYALAVEKLAALCARIIPRGPYVLITSAVTLLLLIAVIAVAIRFGWATRPIPMKPEMSLLQIGLNAYKLSLLVVSVFSIGILLVVHAAGAGFPARLPEAAILDRWSYKSILVGLVLMTLVLITGSIWANYAWGRFWSWDPKENWALITLLTYAAYMHARMARSWSPKATAVFAIVGIVVVIFTYLGVNLFLGGLHSYGRPS